jgi:two-component system, OmpR family, response regulator ChvI
VQVLRQGLELKGLQVDAYGSPQEALQCFKPDVYDLAILDIKIPDINGFQLYREMKKLYPTTTACFLSAFEIRHDEFKKVFPSMRQVKAIFKKPISINELLSKFYSFIEVVCSRQGGSRLAIVHFASPFLAFDLFDLERFPQTNYTNPFQK